MIDVSNAKFILRKNSVKIIKTTINIIHQLTNHFFVVEVLYFIKLSIFLTLVDLDNARLGILLFSAAFLATFCLTGFATGDDLVLKVSTFELIFLYNIGTGVASLVDAEGAVASAGLGVSGVIPEIRFTVGGFVPFEKVASFLDSSNSKVVVARRLI